MASHLYTDQTVSATIPDTSVESENEATMAASGEGQALLEPETIKIWRPPAGLCLDSTWFVRIAYCLTWPTSKY